MARLGGRRWNLGAVIASACALLATPLCLSEDTDEAAFEHVCRLKLTALYRAMTQFASEHDGYLPAAWMSPDIKTPFSGHGSWFLALKPYLDTAGERTSCGYRKGRRQPASLVTHCPANPYWYGGYGPNCVGYAWNANLGLIAVREGKRSGPGPFRFADIAQKDRTILALDAGMAPGRPPYCVYHAARPGEAGAWHDGKVNVLFLDGHIETLAPEAIKKEWFRVHMRRAVPP